MTEDQGREATPERRRGVDDVKALIRWVGVIVALFSLGTPIFLAGYNWAQVRELATAQAAFQVSATTEFQRKDVAGREYMALISRLDDLARQVERMQATIDVYKDDRRRLP